MNRIKITEESEPNNTIYIGKLKILTGGDSILLGEPKPFRSINDIIPKTF